MNLKSQLLLIIVNGGSNDKKVCLLWFQVFSYMIKGFRCNAFKSFLMSFHFWVLLTVDEGSDINLTSNVVYKEVFQNVHWLLLLLLIIYRNDISYGISHWLSYFVVFLCKLKMTFSYIFIVAIVDPCETREHNLVTINNFSFVSKLRVTPSSFGGHAGFGLVGILGDLDNEISLARSATSDTFNSSNKFFKVFELYNLSHVSGVLDYRSFKTHKTKNFFNKTKCSKPQLQKNYVLLVRHMRSKKYFISHIINS